MNSLNSLFHSTCLLIKLIMVLNISHYQHFVYHQLYIKTIPSEIAWYYYLNGLLMIIKKRNLLEECLKGELDVILELPLIRIIGFHLINLKMIIILLEKLEKFSLFLYMSIKDIEGDRKKLNFRKWNFQNAINS